MCWGGGSFSPLPQVQVVKSLSPSATGGHCRPVFPQGSLRGAKGKPGSLLQGAVALRAPRPTCSFGGTKPAKSGMARATLRRFPRETGVGDPGLPARSALECGAKGSTGQARVTAGHGAGLHLGVDPPHLSAPPPARLGPSPPGPRPRPLCHAHEGSAAEKGSPRAAESPMKSTFFPSPRAWHKPAVSQWPLIHRPPRCPADSPWQLLRFQRLYRASLQVSPPARGSPSKAL